jgi:hypothetical protein
MPDCPRRAPLRRTMQKTKPKEFRWGTHFKNGKLYVFDKTSVLVARPWPELRAWRLTARRRVWRPVRPEINVSTPAVYSQGTPRCAYPPSEWLGEDLLPPPAATPASEESREDKGVVAWAERRMEANRLACEEFFVPMPEPVRQRIDQFTTRQWHLAVMLARCPGSEDLMHSTPALAFALASNWAFHRPAVRQPVRAARSWVRRSQRELAGWLGFPATEASVRLLRKIPPAACHVASLLYLRTAMRDAETRERLSHTRHLDATTLRLMSDERVRGRVSSGFVTALAAAAPGVETISQHVHTLRDILEMETLLPEVSVPCFTSIRQLIQHHDALAAQLNRDGVSAWGNVQFPPPPLPGTDEIVPLLSPDALLAEGREQGNCVASYARRVARGGQFIYRVLAPERATLLVVWGQDGWKLGQLAGPRNKPVTAVTRHAIERWLARRGLEEEDPF